MSDQDEKPQNKTTEKKPATTEKKPSDNPALHAKRAEKKSRWTLEVCKKYAKRFQNETEWFNGAPSSYKAAKAKNWLKECCACFQPAPLKNTKKNFKGAA